MKNIVPQLLEIRGYTTYVTFVAGSMFIAEMNLLLIEEAFVPGSNEIPRFWQKQLKEQGGFLASKSLTLHNEWEEFLNDFSGPKKCLSSGKNINYYAPVYMNYYNIEIRVHTYLSHNKYNISFAKYHARLIHTLKASSITRQYKYMLLYSIYTKQ